MAKHKLMWFVNGPSDPEVCEKIGKYMVDVLIVDEEGLDLNIFPCDPERVGHDIGITSNMKHSMYRRVYGEGNYTFVRIPDDEAGDNWKVQRAVQKYEERTADKPNYNPATDGNTDSIIL